MVPLTSLLVPILLAAVRAADVSPRDAMALPLPPGVRTAYIRRDSLVLLARPNGN